MSNLGGFSEEALQLFQLAASEQGYEFSEKEENYDFSRCVRPDGSAYGTGGTCRKGSQQEKSPSEKLKEASANNPAVARREKDKKLAAEKTRAMYERSAQRRAEDDRQKNISDAKARVKEIQEEIKNRGPHSKEEKADLARQLKMAQNSLNRFETGKAMTREQFQTGLKKMSAKQEEAAKAKSPAVVKEKLTKQEEAMDRLAKEIRGQDGPARYQQIENNKALHKEILESRKRLNYGPGNRPDLGGKYKDPNDINKQYDDLKID